MRWVLAGVLAFMAAVATNLTAAGLLGIAPGVEAQVLAAFAGVLVGAGYEALARPDGPEGGEG